MHSLTGNCKPGIYSHLYGAAAPLPIVKSPRIPPRAFLLVLSLLFVSPSARAQAGNTNQFLFAVEGGQTPSVVTYIVDQTTGALSTPAGVNPVPMRGSLPLSNYAAPTVNPAGTFLFVPVTDSNNQAAVSVFSISSTGSLAELAASPFSAGNSTFPLGVVVSLDGQYLYALSGDNNANPSTCVLNAYSIAADGTLTPVNNYSLPEETEFLYLHPTGRWLYTYGNGVSGGEVPSVIEKFTVGLSGTLTDDGTFTLETFSYPVWGLVGDNSGKFLYTLHGQFADSYTMVDALSVNGGTGDLSEVSTYTDMGGIVLTASPPEQEAIDSTGRFVFSTVADFSTSNGIFSLLPSSIPSDYQYPAPLLLASRTSPFLFVAGEGQGQTQAGGYYLSSYLINSDGTLTPAPGSPYTTSLNSYTLAITGSVLAPTAPSLTLSSNSITFGLISPGQNVSSSVGLSNSGFGPLIINTISISGDPSFTQTSNCLTTLAPGATCTINLTWSPTTAGTFTGNLNIDSNVPAASVSLTGTTAPAVSSPFVSPNSLTFPSTTIGVASASQTFTIENLPQATASLLVSGFGFSGSNPSDFSQTNNCTAAIPVGGSCAVMVVFTPLAVGSRSANFIFSTNDQNELNLSNLVMGVGASGTTQYQLQTSAVGPGTIQQTPSGTSFNANTSITLTAVPNTNSSFTSWSGACAGSSNTVCTFSITANTTVTATFTAIAQYQLQTSAVGPGTIQQTPSGTSFNTNTSITLTAVPNANSSFTSWAGACAGSTNTVCAFNITANTTVTATFTANPALVIPQGQQSGAAGNTFTFQINETGFTTQPTLTASCSIPNGACSISGTTLTVTTSARSSSFVPIRFPTLPVGLMLTLAILMFGVSPHARRAFRRATLVGGLTLLAACGGGGTVTQNNGTPAGTYVVTVHATSGSQTATTTVSVIVQ